jgi:hypothetical protein
VAILVLLYVLYEVYLRAKTTAIPSGTTTVLGGGAGGPQALPLSYSEYTAPDSYNSPLVLLQQAASAKPSDTGVNATSESDLTPAQVSNSAVSPLISDTGSVFDTDFQAAGVQVADPSANLLQILMPGEGVS